MEGCLLKDERVREAAVVGVEGQEGLTRLKAYIVLEPDVVASESLVGEIQEFVKTGWAAHKYPRLVEFIPSLPKNDRGKVNRKLLRAQGA